MKKFNVIEFSDCRGCSDVNDVWNIEGSSGKEVFEKIIEIEIEEGYDGWIEYVSGMSGLENNNWIKDSSKWKDIFYIEGDIEGKEFNICMSDELRDFMLIREDSEYYNKFFNGSDEEKVELYYNILEKFWVK